MAYFVNLFSPQTYKSVSDSEFTLTGFKLRQKKAAERIKIGDKFICYLTKLSRWFAVYEVTSECFEDSTPVFVKEDDPYVLRFKVRVIAALDVDKAIPMQDERLWHHLSFTKELPKGSSNWTGVVRNSLNALTEQDGAYLEQQIVQQTKDAVLYPLSDADEKQFEVNIVRSLEGEVPVSIPKDDDETEVTEPQASSVRESIKIQALLAEIGAKMGYKIWLPRNDLNAVLNEWHGDEAAITKILPLNYDETTIKTVEQIDVLWLKGRSIVRAFEVEHTTAIYSGILRMADLLALQPNMNIHLHIVAPEERRNKVFQEILRPVFSLLEGGALSKKCTYISYGSIQELYETPYLAHTSDSILEDFQEEAE